MKIRGLIYNIGTLFVLYIIAPRALRFGQIWKISKTLCLGFWRTNLKFFTPFQSLPSKGKELNFQFCFFFVSMSHCSVWFLRRLVKREENLGSGTSLLRVVAFVKALSFPSFSNSFLATKRSCTCWSGGVGYFMVDIDCSLTWSVLWVNLF